MVIANPERVLRASVKEGDKQFDSWGDCWQYCWDFNNQSIDEILTNKK